MAGIFKAYDIRGIYGDTLTNDIAHKLGKAYATLLKCKKVVVGRDMRPHSIDLFDALAKGLTGQGVDVIDVGMCSTPMSYYANGKLKADGSIMITASHNPGEWNGFKLCRAQAVPISGATGIMDLERIIQEESFDPPAQTGGTILKYDILPEYVLHIREQISVDTPIHIVVDYANAMGLMEGRVFDGVLQVEPMYDTMDGTFPNHEANPLKHDTLRDLQEKVQAGDYDFGISFDGDADRVGFVDEKGTIIPMDIITALIAQTILRKEGGGTIYYDLRSSWAVKEVIEENHGRALMSRVGHAFIKQQMRDEDAVFAGELSGHYYFKENFFTESSSLAVLYVAALVSQTGKALSELIKPIQRYYGSGEINSEVEEDQNAIFARLKAQYSDGQAIELDGLSIEYPDWWFNVRASNTEPLIRLNLEARDESLMEEKRDEVLGAIRGE